MQNQCMDLFWFFLHKDLKLIALIFFGEIFIDLLGQKGLKMGPELGF